VATTAFRASLFVGMAVRTNNVNATVAVLGEFDLCAEARGVVAAQDKQNGMHETVNGFVRVFAKNRDIPGNSEVRNLLRTQEQATPGNPVKYFEVLAGTIS